MKKGKHTKKHNGKQKYRNPHYSPRKKLPQKRGSSRFTEARFFSHGKGGIAFRLLTSVDSDGMLTECIDESEKYYIDARHTRGAINGDTVKLRIISERDARVEEILSHAVTELFGTLYAGEDEEGGLVWVAEPDDVHLKFSVIITGDRSGEAEHSDGDRVLVSITEYPDGEYPDAEGVILKNYGDATSRKANYLSILDSHGVITEFSVQALAEAERRSAEKISHDGRIDLRGENIFTLDGADAKDLDDAISVKKRGNNRVLCVHIADVSHYVNRSSALEREASARGTSIYFADRVIPMLPQALSNGICSLNSGVDRYTLTAEMEIDSQGNIVNTDIYRSVIRSRIRGVYSEFNKLVFGCYGEENDGEIFECGEAELSALKEKYAAIATDIPELLSLYRILKDKSRRRGALELDTKEAAVILDENGEPVDMRARIRGIGELMIEQFMLCANEGVASKLTSLGLPCVYRVHAQPDGDKLSAFIRFTHNLGLKPPFVKSGASLDAAYFSDILERAKERELGSVVSYVMLRTMMKARYDAVNSGHFGLSSDCYCHFTSPIRRYPDLAVHRIINAAIDHSGGGQAYLLNGNYSDISEKYRGFAANSAKSSSECELKALAVEREMDELFRVLYMSRHVGEEYDAEITSVTSFGFFCTLPNTCEGLVPLRTLDGYYEFNEGRMALESYFKSYKLGDRVRIRVDSVDIPTHKIDFRLV